MLWTSILATDLLGLGLGIWLLWGGGRARAPGWGGDVRRLCWLGAGLASLAIALGTAMGSGFLVLRLCCHALFCVLAPLVIARGAERRGARGIALVALGLVAEGCYVWARCVEPYRLEVTHHEIRSERLAGLGEPLTIAVLSDLQTDALGSFEAEVFAAMDAERPDLVLVPGDLLQLPADDSPGSAARERAELVALFDGLRHRPRLGFLMVDGDCELPGAGLPEAGVRLLEDEVARFEDEHLQVIGLTRRSSRRAFDERLAAAARGFDGLTLVLGHAPEFARTATEAGVPLLCVAGHTHGGQVQLPLIGPLITLSHMPRAIAAGGLFPLGDSWLCVSRGIGMERGYAPRIRFLCRPELVVLRLSAGAPASPSGGTTSAASLAARDRAASSR
jgi:predicted MPP superfamily phosphohydrolase